MAVTGRPRVPREILPHLDWLFTRDLFSYCSVGMTIDVPTYCIKIVVAFRPGMRRGRFAEKYWLVNIRCCFSAGRRRVWRTRKGLRRFVRDARSRSTKK